MPVQTGGWDWQRCECCRVTAECRGPTSTTTPPKVLQAEVSHLNEVLQPEVSLLTKVARNLSSTEVQLHPPAASPSNTSLTFHCFSSSTLPLSQQAAASCSPTVTLSLCSSATTENNSVRQSFHKKLELGTLGWILVRAHFTGNPFAFCHKTVWHLRQKTSQSCSR